MAKRFFHLGISLILLLFPVGPVGLTNDKAAPVNDFAEKDSKYAQINVNGQLKFEIPGDAGFYRETQTVKYTIQAGCPVKIQFSASPLVYTGDGRKGRQPVSLDVMYWVNQPRGSSFGFRPNDRPLTLYRNDRRGGVYEYVLYGGVTIHEISAQFAGNYRGTVTVTVSAQE